jgi:hypothetical protein
MTSNYQYGGHIDFHLQFLKNWRLAFAIAFVFHL